MTPAEFKAARLSLGLTAKALAELYGVHLRTITKWESGKHRMKARDVKLMEMILLQNRGQKVDCRDR